MPTEGDGEPPPLCYEGGKMREAYREFGASRSLFCWLFAGWKSYFTRSIVHHYKLLCWLFVGYLSVGLSDRWRCAVAVSPQSVPARQAVAHCGGQNLPAGGVCCPWWVHHQNRSRQPHRWAAYAHRREPSPQPISRQNPDRWKRQTRQTRHPYARATALATTTKKIQNMQKKM